MSRHGRARAEPFRTGRGSAALLALALFAGCTAVAGLDKEYVAELEGAQGGTAGRGGSAGSAGSGTGGTGATTCDDSGCASGTKCCGVPEYADAGFSPDERQCVEPSPTFGCGSTGCDPCPFPPPDHSISVCRDGRCGIQCRPGFLEQDGQCIPDGSGGTGGAGSGGSGGGAPTCDPSQCPGCGFAGPFGCCRDDGSGCGCTWAPLYCW